MSGNKIDTEVEKTIGILRETKEVDSDPLLYDKVALRIAEQSKREDYGHSSIRMKIGYALITVLILFNFITSVYVFNQTESIANDSAYQEFSQDLNINGNDDIYSQL